MTTFCNGSLYLCTYVSWVKVFVKDLEDTQTWSVSSLPCPNGRSSQLFCDWAPPGSETARTEASAERIQNVVRITLIVPRSEWATFHASLHYYIRKNICSPEQVEWSKKTEVCGASGHGQASYECNGPPGAAFVAKTENKGSQRRGGFVIFTF